MLRLISLITLIVGVSNLYAQSDNTEKERNPMLIGTTVLTDSDNNWLSMNYGYDLKKISATDCDSKNSKGMKDSVINVDYSNNIMLVKTNIVSNCCHSFLGEIKIQSDTLNLIYIGYGNNCSCTCCFGLSYEINTEYSEDSLKYIMINGDLSSLKKIE